MLLLEDFELIVHCKGLAMNPGACKLQLNSGKITNLENIGLTTILNHGVNQNFYSKSSDSTQNCDKYGSIYAKFHFLIQKTVTELQTSLSFAHEVSHNLGATHEVDENGYAISGTLMGATLGNNITTSNLKVSKETKEEIGNFFTRVKKGIRYELFETMYNTTHIYIHKWPQDDQARFLQGYHEINCLKANLNYSNDDKHYLKLRKELEKQDNPTTPKPRTKPTPKPTPKLTTKPTSKPIP